ncbi:MAG: hypothetical protein FJX77_02655 [Armatimonadetes bacterium]|nr:hypothetical protein [Armatimonadota bacterium]
MPGRTRGECGPGAWEQTQPQPGDDPAANLANAQVRLPNGRRNALNMWAFRFLRRARFTWPYQEGVGGPAQYVLPPDLLVERLDRSTLKRLVARMLPAGELRPEWRCPHEGPDPEPGALERTGE